MVIACAIFSLSLQSLFVLILYDAELQLSKHHLESCAGFVMDAFDAQQAQVEATPVRFTKRVPEMLGEHDPRHLHFTTCCRAS